MRWAPEILIYLRENIWRNSGGKCFSLNDACTAFHKKFPDVKLAKNQLRGYETGSHTPRADMVANLADLYEIPVQCLFVGAGTVLDSTDLVRSHLVNHGVIGDD